MKIDISTGELVDKVTILSIKLEKFKDEVKKANVQKEYDMLSVPMNELGIMTTSNEFKDLREINLKLWHIEDDIRIEESKSDFGAKFIELARSVYFINDDRAAVKKEINLKYKSDLIEEKEYVDYKKQ